MGWGVELCVMLWLKYSDAKNVLVSITEASGQGWGALLRRLVPALHVSMDELHQTAPSNSRRSERTRTYCGLKPGTLSNVTPTWQGRTGMVGFLGDTMRKRTDGRNVGAQANNVRVFWGWEMKLGGKGHFSTIGELDRCGLWMDDHKWKETLPRQHVPPGHFFCERMNRRHRFQKDCSMVYLAETLKIVMRTRGK
jgi:hypothetical protein